MSRSKWIVRVTLLVALAAAGTFAVVKAREMHEVATGTADDIEAQLGALDPVTRAAVVAKLSSDVAKDVMAKQS